METSRSFDSQDIGVSAERAAHTTLQQRNRLLERQLTERTQELGRSLVDLRSLATALDAAEQRERTHLANRVARLSGAVARARPYETRTPATTPLPSAGDAMVQEVEDMLTHAFQYCQTLMAELSPPVLHEQGLVAGIRALATQMKRYDLEVRVDLDRMR